jgi:uncharacterized sporulation protein YeaH/YhbH (DUF444 family)
VHPGNTQYVSGDKIKRPPPVDNGGSGDQSSEDEIGSDDFAFEISREEFMEIFFEDLELPNMDKTQIDRTIEHDSVGAGHTINGVPSNIDIVRSMRGSMTRRMALQAPLKRTLRDRQAELIALLALEFQNANEVAQLEDDIAQLKRRIAAVPFIDEFDLRYHNRGQRPKPKTQAVMFCLMDVSGSMSEQRKDIAKRFFILLHYFLTRTYEHIQVVFIRHHMSAAEVDENTFFNSPETGGTIVSSALKLMMKIIDARFPATDWNIYAAQASDGDNWLHDSNQCGFLLTEQILPKTQYYAYVQIESEQKQQLWQETGCDPVRPSPFRNAEHQGTRRNLSCFAPTDEKVRIMTHRIITDSPDWTFETIEKYEREIARIAAASRLDTYPNQLEIISSEQMIDAYSLVGLPVGYTHWSFGKQFLSTEQNYRKGHMGLAYEIVITSDPCISYLMEENTATMQALVIAHAAFGHNSFFKGNYLFRSWTKADAIIDYLVFARDYVAQCESRHGELEVDLLLDSCHALMNYGVDTGLRPHCRTADEERAGVLARLRYREENANDLWRTVHQETIDERPPPEFVFPTDPQETILYFIEKNAPHMEPWKREIVRIVRKIAQYFHPQRQTKVMNEGWASFWRYTLINTLHDEGFLSNGQMMEFL